MRGFLAMLTPRWCRGTRYAAYGRCARTTTASQWLMRAARAHLGAPLLSTNKAPGRMPPQPLVAPLVVCPEPQRRHATSGAIRMSRWLAGRLRGRRGAQGQGGRAKRASTTDLPGLSECSGAAAKRVPRRLLGTSTGEQSAAKRRTNPVGALTAIGSAPPRAATKKRNTRCKPKALNRALNPTRPAPSPSGGDR